MYVWFYSVTYLDNNVGLATVGGEETGHLRSNSDEALTVATQLYKYLGEGYKIKNLQFNGEIVDVGVHKKAL